ncbi:MAG TPA: GNAT family N-acetyltransferase [Devosiaceae bacterium]|nr:GNAT family N-acetyltransferase [Devosiaceae bacterium]
MSDPEFTIRDFAWGDVPRITAIYAHYVRTSVATFDTDVPGEPEIAAKWGHMVELGHPALVAERDGELLGYAYASFYRPRAGYRFTCEDTVYIAPEMVGRGLGSTLLGAVIERARAFGFKQMLGVIADEIEPSIKLHAKHGFEIVARQPNLGFKFDRWVGIVHMQKAL